MPIMLVSQKEWRGKTRQANRPVLLQKPQPFQSVVEVVRRLLG